MNTTTINRTKIIKQILCFAAALVVLALAWKMVTSSEDDNVGKFQVLFLKMWGDVCATLTPAAAQLLLNVMETLTWASHQVSLTMSIGLALMESNWFHFLFLTTRAVSWMSHQLLFVKMQALALLGSIWFQVLIVKASASSWTSHKALMIVAVGRYTAQYISAVAHLILGVHDPELINIYTLPFRIVASVVLTVTSISTGASFLTTIASGIAPLVLAHDIGLLTTLEQRLIKPLHFFLAFTAATIYVTPHRYYFPIVATQVAYFFVKGTIGCFSIQNPLHYYLGLVLWLLMTADAAWLVKIFLFPLSSDDDLPPRVKLHMALEVTKHVSVWAATWNLLSIGVELVHVESE
jgi:hypothetical protein